MKNIFTFLLILVGILCLTTGKATTYYYNAAGGANITSTGSWWTVSNYTGTNPGSFTSGNTYNITGTGSVTIASSWAVGGTLQVGDGTNACTFTIPSGYAVTSGTVAVSANATLAIANATIPTLGTLSTGSTVTFSGSVAQSVPSKTYSNLTIYNSGYVATAGGNLTVNGVLTINASSTLNMLTNTLAGTTLTTAGSASGILETQYTSSGAIPATTTNWAFTIEYNSTVSTQTLPNVSGGNTFAGLIIANTFGTVGLYGNITINGTLTIADGAILSAGSYTIGGSSFTTSNNSGSGTGKLTTTCPTTTSATPIPTGVTYNFEVDYNSGSTQTIVAATYSKNLNLSTGAGSKTLSSTGSIYIGGVFTPGSTNVTTGSTVIFAGTAAQTIPTLTYNNLSATNTSATVSAGGAIGVSGVLTVANNATLDMTTYQLTGSFTTSGTGTLKTAYVSGTNQAIPSNTYSFALNYDAASGGQYLGGTYNNGLTFSNTSGTNTATGTVSISGVLAITNAGSTLNMVGHILQGSITQTTATSGNSGTTIILSATNANITTGMSVYGNSIPVGTTVSSISGTTLTLSQAATGAITSAVTLTFGLTTSGAGTLETTDITSGSITLPPASYAFTVEFNGAGNQTMPNGLCAFNNLIVANTGYTTGLFGAATISGILTIYDGATFSVGTNVLSGSFTTSNNSGSGTGKLTTTNTTSTPLPAGITYNYEVDYNGSSSQTIVAGNYINLNGTGGNRTLGSTGTIAISGTFTAGTGTYTTTGSTFSLGGTATLPTIAFNNLIIAGAITAPSTLTITGNLTINSGATFTAPSGNFNVGGNWINNGTFTNNSGTVVFNGVYQTINGSSTFYNLTKTVTAADVLTFQAGSTQNITGTLTLAGTSGNLLEVYSSSITSQANINPSGTRAISYVAVSGMDNTNATAIIPTNAVNDGNNTNWSLSTPNTVGDLETVPSTWAATNGTLAVDTNHYRLGTRSVAWKWNANDTLKISGIGFDSTLLFNYNYNTMDVSIYNTATRSDSIQFLFYDRYQKIRYYFSVHLSYKGWYETIRSYRYNMFIPSGTPSTPDSLMSVYIVAPHTGSGQLNFDAVNWIHAVFNPISPISLMMPDSIIKTSAGYPPYDGNTIYNLPPNISLSTPSSADIADLNTVRASYLSDLQSSAASTATPSNLAAANSYYIANGFMLNSDGTAKGAAIFSYPVQPGGAFTSFTQYLQIFAYSWYNNNSDTVSLNKAIVMLRYLLDNGNFAGGCYKIGAYDAEQFHTTLAALSNQLYATDTTLFNSLANYERWQNNFGAAWMPSSVYSPLFTDQVREEITGYLAYPLFMIRDTATAIQNLRGFRQLLSNFMQLGDGVEENMKVDGSGFHHLGHYYLYVETVYSNLPQWLYHLRNTQFKPDSVTYTRIRDMAYNFLLQQNTFGTTYGNKGENAQSFLDNPTDISRLANLGNGITGSTPDYMTGCMYNRLFPGTPDATIPTSSYPAEAYPSGFTQMNYATMGIYRQHNWLSTIKMLSPTFWGAQCGEAGRDYFSRYLGYGSIDVQYSNGMDSSGYTTDSYKYHNGYDHRFPNGATTIVLSLDSMASYTSPGNEFANTGSIAGSMSFNNRVTNYSFKTRGDFGLSAMNFKQAATGFNNGCGGGQRDTTFKFQKSWFAFDSIIVCLGSGITNHISTSKTATNIFQLTDSAQTIYINGTANNTFNYTNSLIGTGPYQLVSPYGTGYYVKSSDSLHISVTKQQFTLNLNGSTSNSSGNWANVWLDHGNAPSNKGYQYVIIPSTTPTALAQFADSMASPTSAYYTVKEADSIMHYVYYKPRQIQAYAIFRATTNTDTSSIIKSVDNPCYAMGINQGDTMLSLTVMNPNPNLQTSTTQSSVFNSAYISKSVSTPVNITLRGQWNFISNDTNIHIVNTTDTTTQILINTQYSLPYDAVFTSANTTWNGTAWSSGAPTVFKNAIVNANLTVSGSISAGSLTVNSGDTITNNGTIQIASNNLTNNGVVRGTGNTILNGSTTQTISGIGVISNLTINNPSGASINSGSNSLCINGLLTLINGQLTTNGNLILRSDSNSTGAIAQYGINGNGGSISGNVTVQRYISAKTARRYSFVGSPVSQTIGNAWQQQIYITGAGTGGVPCGSTTGNGVLSSDKYNSNGFDVTQTNTPSMFTYNATKVNGSRYVSVSNTTSASLTPGTGYCMNIRGNRNSGDVTCANQLETASPTAPETVTLSATGTVTTGNVTIALNNPAVHPYTLLANPYPSQISFTALQASNSNTYNKMWTFCPLGNGNYTTYSAGVIANGATGYDNTSGNYIASGQAFFVEASTSGSITFQESHKSTGAIPNTQYFGATTNKLIRVGLKTTTDNLLDEVVVRFNSSDTKTYNPNWDAQSFNNASQVLTTLKDTVALAISTLPDSLAVDTAQLGVSSNANGTFRLLFSDYQGIDSSVSITLKDNFLGINQDIRASQVYDFNVTSDTASQGNKRFEIVFNGGSALAVNSIQASATMVDKAALITWNTVGEKGESYYAVEKSSDAKTFNQIGEEAAKNTATASYNFTDNNPSSINYYRIKAIGAMGAITYSNIAKLTPNALSITPFTLYPNPLVGKTLTVALTNIPAGKYDISIYNALGEKVREKSIAHSGGTGSYGLTINNNLTSGTYLVSISDAVSKAMVYQGKLMVR